MESLIRSKQLDLPAVPVSTQLRERAFQIANRHGRSFYDSLYVGAAVSQQATLSTADEKLANANGWARFERAKSPFLQSKSMTYGGCTPSQSPYLTTTH